MQVKAIKRGNTIELLEELNLPEDREIVLDICAIATAEPLETRSSATFGSAKGQVWMSDDFDEPLEDFQEYME